MYLGTVKIFGNIFDNWFFLNKQLHTCDRVQMSCHMGRLGVPCSHWRQPIESRQMSHSHWSQQLPLYFGLHLFWVQWQWDVVCEWERPRVGELYQLLQSVCTRQVSHYAAEFNLSVDCHSALECWPCGVLFLSVSWNL